MNTTESEVSPNQIAAFFDLDGTLLPAPSLEWRFIAYLLSQDEISADHMICWLGHWAKTFPRNPRAAANANKYYLAGLRESLVGDWADESADFAEDLDWAARLGIFAFRLANRRLISVW